MGKSLQDGASSPEHVGLPGAQHSWRQTLLEFAHLLSSSSLLVENVGDAEAPAGLSGLPPSFPICDSEQPAGGGEMPVGSWCPVLKPRTDTPPEGGEHVAGQLVER